MKKDFGMNEKEMDRRLQSPAQVQMGEVIKALPEETLSLAWRSELNTKLRAQAIHRRKLNLFGWLWKPAAGVALAGCLAVAFVFHEPAPQTPAASGGIESALVGDYVDSTASWEVAGDGASVSEVKDA